MPEVEDLLNLKQGSVSLATINVTAQRATQGLGLVQEERMMTPIRVETKQHARQIMETNTSKPWDTSWSSNYRNRLSKNFQNISLILIIAMMQCLKI